MIDDKFLLALWNVCQSAKLVETGRTLDDARHAFDRYISDGEDSDSAMKAALGHVDEIIYGYHDGKIKCAGQ